jgi:hypothetical protein
MGPHLSRYAVPIRILTLLFDRASDDPRLSIEDRYASVEAYTAAAKKAIDDLIAKRCMLREDADANLQRLVRLWQSMVDGGRGSQQTR